MVDEIVQLGRFVLRWLGRALILLVAPILFLVLLNWSLSEAIDDKKFIPFGLWGDVAFAVLMLATGELFVLFLLKIRPGWWALSVPYALFVVVGLPLTFALPALWKKDSPVPRNNPVPAAVDLLIVQPPLSLFDRPQRVLPAPAEDIQRWDTRYSIATAPRSRYPFPRDFGLRLEGVALDRAQAHQALAKRESKGGFGNLIRPRPQATRTFELLKSPWARDVDRAIVLNVDGIDPWTLLSGPPSSLSTPTDWSLAVEAASRWGEAPVYAIVGGFDRKRLRTWRTWAQHQARGGDAVLFNDLGRLLLVDAALRAATESSDIRSDEALAWRYRPRLLFDDQEQWPNPVDVDDLFSSGHVKMCGKELQPNECKQLRRSSDLNNEYSRLEFQDDGCSQLFKSQAAASRTTLYYHVVRRPPTDPDRVYVDYWWYFPCNPTPTSAKKVFCGPGFNIPGLTCHSHRSDWEGITVTLLRLPTGVLSLDAIIYGQHEFGVKYDWTELREKWKDRGTFSGDRPLVYIAQDSHASYPLPCDTRLGCGQIVLPFIRRDGPHDGGDDWDARNDCGSLCLRALPLTRKSDKPALWNAFRGPWGDVNCILWGAVCDLGRAPNAPFWQGRYERPWKPLIKGKTKTAGGLHVRYGNY